MRLDVETLVVRIPMRFQRRGGRKRIVAPDGSACLRRKEAADRRHNAVHSCSAMQRRFAASSHNARRPSATTLLKPKLRQSDADALSV